MLSRVVPISAHAAFDKAAAYFGIKVHTIPVDTQSRQVDLKRVARAMCAYHYSFVELCIDITRSLSNPNTIMVN
jgi:hypothetical protein